MLAEQTGLSLRTLSLLERAEREPRPATIAALAAALECEPVAMMEPER